MAPPKPITYIRDQITIDKAFAVEIQAELDYRNTKAGTPLCFIAREIKHASKYTFALHGYPLIFVADTYNGNSGAIDTTDNSWGAWNGEAGKVGVPGGAGGNGVSASPITLVAQKIVNARLIASGTPGANGGKAGNGGNGADAEVDYGTNDDGSGGKGTGPVQ